MVWLPVPLKFTVFALEAKSIVPVKVRRFPFPVKNKFELNPISPFVKLPVPATFPFKVKRLYFYSLH